MPSLLNCEAVFLKLFEGSNLPLVKSLRKFAKLSKVGENQLQGFFCLFVEKKKTFRIVRDFEKGEFEFRGDDCIYIPV